MKKLNSIRHLIALVVVLALMLATSAVVYATTGTVTITGGTLSVTPADVALSGVALVGTDTTSTSTSNAWTAKDPTGTGAGWHLTIASTDFTNDDVQMVYNGATSGTFTLTYAGETTGAIAYNASAAAIKTAVELLSNVDLVTVTGSGTSSVPWVIRFVTASGSGIMTAGDGSLVGGTSTITLATIDISVTDQQFGITLSDSEVVVTVGNTQPTSSVTTLTDIANGTVNFLSAATDTGMGNYTLNPDFTLEVRAETYAGTYTATITIAIVSAP